LLSAVESPNNWGKMEAAEKAFWPKFINNSNFTTLIKQYSKTAF
jgi:hypothetical protein